MHLLAVHQQQLPLGQNRWWIRCFFAGGILKLHHVFCCNVVFSPQGQAAKTGEDRGENLRKMSDEV